MQRSLGYLILFVFTLGCNRFDESLNSAEEVPLNIDPSSMQALTAASVSGGITAASVSGGITYYVCVSATSCGAGWKTGNDKNTKAQAKSKSTPWRTIE